MAHIDKSYYNRNFNAKNPLRRFAHRTRFKHSIAAIELIDQLSILDFGAGDGLFLNQIYALKSDARLIGYEPYLEAIEENKIALIKDWSNILNHIETKGKFDYVGCFEVLEHYNPADQAEALKKMREAVKDSGTVVISVPIEKGLPSLVKNLIRRVNLPHSNHIFTISNILGSLLGKDLSHLRKEPKYHSHMGFYFTDLEQEIVKHFVIKKKSYSPIGGPSYQVNSQVFYQLEPTI
jgi:2-polyprenyl-3-methyl-5-hydroxy-6-metoxy-1,4-benzoquinol methylase